MEMNFCRRCGTPLTNPNGHAYVCEQGHTLYLNPAPTVGIFLFDEDDNLLLSVRGIEPHKGTLDAFGGFIDGDETIEQALVREMKEELGLEPSDYSEPVYVTSAPAPYDFGGEAVPVLSCVFYAKLLPGVVPVAQDDVAEIRRIKLDDVNPADIGNVDIRQSFLVLRDLLTA